MRRFTGPYWSDVLGLFGQNGSVNNVLRNRDEAQLEDKACRNKIWYLKSGIKFPFYLRLVTGDRKKTAPAAIGDGKGEKGAGEDNGQVKSDVAVTSDEGTRCEPHSPPVVAPPPPQHYPSIPLLQYPDPGYRGPTPAYRDSRGVLHLGLPPQFHVPHLVNGVPAEPPSFQYRRDSQGNLYQVPYVPPAMRGPPVPSLQPPMRSPSMREHGHGPAVTEIAPTAPEYAIDVDDVS